MILCCLWWGGCHATPIQGSIRLFSFFKKASEKAASVFFTDCASLVHYVFATLITGYSRSTRDWLVVRYCCHFLSWYIFKYLKSIFGFFKCFLTFEYLFKSVLKKRSSHFPQVKSEQTLTSSLCLDLKCIRFYPVAISSQQQFTHPAYRISIPFRLKWVFGLVNIFLWTS